MTYRTLSNAYRYSILRRIEMNISGYGNIRNFKSYQSKIANWQPLNKCFGEGIRVTDIDGAVERNGHCLWLEMKTPGAQIEKGQYWFYANQAQLGHVVIFIYGTVENPEYIRILRKKN